MGSREERDREAERNPNGPWHSSSCTRPGSHRRATRCSGIAAGGGRDVPYSCCAPVWCASGMVISRAAVPQGWRDGDKWGWDAGARLLTAVTMPESDRAPRGSAGGRRGCAPIYTQRICYVRLSDGKWRAGAELGSLQSRSLAIAAL